MSISRRRFLLASAFEPVLTCTAVVRDAAGAEQPRSGAPEDGEEGGVGVWGYTPSPSPLPEGEGFSV